MAGALRPPGARCAAAATTTPAGDATPKPTPAQVRAQARRIKYEYAGVIDSRVARETGRVVTLYRSAEAGLDDAGGDAPYTLTCEDHHFTMAITSVKQGLAQITNPLGWCERCNGQVADDTDDTTGED